MKIKTMLIGFGMLFSSALIVMLCLAENNTHPSSGVDVEVVKEGSRLAASSLNSEQGKIVSLVTARTNDGGTHTAKIEYDIIRSGQRFLLSSVSTVLDVNPPPGSDSEHYVKPGDVIRRQLSFDGQVVTVVQPDIHVARISAHDSSSGRASLCEYEDEVGPYGTLDLSNIDQHIWHGNNYVGSGPKIIGSEAINGSECIVVEMVWTNNSSTTPITETWHIWIDLVKGYTVPRIRKWKQGGVYSGKTLVAEINTELAQIGDVWAPGKVVHNSYRIDRKTGQPYLRQSKTMTYSEDFRVNVPVTDAALKPVLSSGTRVYDEVLDAEYTVP